MQNKNVDNICNVEKVPLRELALFAGTGGGILGGHLLGWRTVCAVEIEPYPAAILAARQNDGILPPFPIWDDIRSFDGKPWSGLVDVVSGGFPCQDISIAGKGAGISGERSGLWSEMFRIVREVRPRYVFVENSPMLVKRGLTRVIGNLAEVGYDAAWTVLGADDVGAPHQRKRLWLLAERKEISDSDSLGREEIQIQTGVATQAIHQTSAGESCRTNRNVSNAEDKGDVRRHGQLQPNEEASSCWNHNRGGAQEDDGGEWWSAEPDVGRVADGIPFRADRLKALGNAQVPLVAAVAFRRLAWILNQNDKLNG